MSRGARSLLVFVQALEGRTLLVELRDDTLVRGRIETVDDAMKCARWNTLRGHTCALQESHLC